MPATKEEAANSRLPIGAILTPFADPSRAESIPLVDTVNQGPLRCRRCRAYANPFVRFDRGGTAFECPFCEFVNTLEAESAVTVDVFGQVDIQSRPELRLGSVDFVATDEYRLGRDPKPLTYVFVLDASGEAARRGVFDAGVSAVRAAVTAAQHSEHASGVKVAVVTFSDRVQFYTVRRGKGTEVLVVSDTEDVFLPVHPSHLAVDVQQDADLIDDLLDQLPTMAQPGSSGDSALGAAMEGARQLCSGGGRLVVVAGRTPSVGAGRVEVRPDYKLYGSDQEGTLLHGVGSFWRELGRQCVQSQVGVDVHLLPASFMEAGQLGHPARVSGGSVRVYAPFLPARDTRHLAAAMQHRISRPSAHDVVVRLRVSAGLAVKRYYGNYEELNPGDVDVAVVDGDSSFAAELQYEDRLPSDGHAFLQCAMLYTTAAGQRRIRLHTLRLPVAADLTAVFQHADLPAILSFTTAAAIQRMRSDKGPIHGVRRTTAERCAAMLGAYRRRCARNPVPGQLVLPETLQLLPLYVLALSKTDGLRPGTHTNIDRRIAALSSLGCISPARILHILYPRLLRLDTAAEELAKVADDERNTEDLLPPPQFLTRSELSDDGVYVLDDTEDVRVMWVGRRCGSNMLQALFGVEQFSRLTDVTGAHLRTDIDQLADNMSDEAVAAAVSVLRRLGDGRCVVRVVKQGEAGERELLSRLVHEAADHNDRSYGDFLAYIHRTIQGQ